MFIFKGVPAVERTELERPIGNITNNMDSNNPPPTPPPTLHASTLNHQIGQQSTTPTQTSVGGNVTPQTTISCPRPSSRPPPNIIVSGSSQIANNTIFQPAIASNGNNNTNTKEVAAISRFPFQTTTRKMTSILSLSVKKNVNGNSVTALKSRVNAQPSTSNTIQPKLIFKPLPSTSTAKPVASNIYVPLSTRENIPQTQQSQQVITLDHSIDEPAGGNSHEEDDKLLNLNDKIAKLQDEIKRVEKQKEEKLQREREEALKKKQQQEQERRRKAEEERRKAQEEKKRRETTRQPTQENVLNGKYSMVYSSI